MTPFGFTITLDNPPITEEKNTILYTLFEKTQKIDFREGGGGGIYGTFWDRNYTSLSVKKVDKMLEITVGV